MEIVNLGNVAVNNYLIALPNGYMLVDTGYEKNYKNFLHNLAKRNIPVHDIHYVFLTHAHDDHAGFLNQLLLDNPNSKVILHRNAVEGLRKGQNSFNGGCSNRFALLFCKAMGLVGHGEHKYPSIDKKFEENYIFIGSEQAHQLEQRFAMQFIETPGHTTCSISLLYRHNLFCGDAAMNGLPSKNKITIWVEDLACYQFSWKKMLDLHPNYIYPGHGKPFRPYKLSANIEKISKRHLFPL